MLIFGLKAPKDIDAGIEAPLADDEVLTQGIHVAGRVPAAIDDRESRLLSSEEIEVATHMLS